VRGWLASCTTSSRTASASWSSRPRRRRSSHATPRVGRGLAGIEATGQQALGELRRLLGLLRRNGDEAALGPQPGLRHVNDLVATVREAGLSVTLAVEGEPAVVPPGVDLSAYRIVQEALTNALKHAGRTRARVTIRYLARELDIEVTDDGAGAEPSRDGGHGLAGMRERVNVYGGSLVAGNRPEGGYALRARLPIERPGA
jgi:signal transduction histidine kinase